jgi:hypothetical protein
VWRPYAGSEAMVVVNHHEGIITLDMIAREPEEGFHTHQGCGACVMEAHM